MMNNNWCNHDGECLLPALCEIKETPKGRPYLVCPICKRVYDVPRRPVWRETTEYDDTMRTYTLERLQ